MKVKRRQLLLGGMATGIAATAGTDYWQRKEEQERQAALEALANQTPRDTDSLLEATFEADARKIFEGKQIQASLQLTPPTIPYSREISKLLILCSKIATQQYLTGKVNPTYDGNIRSLNAYSKQLDRYTQIAAFTGEEIETQEAVEVEVPVQPETQDPLERDVEAAGEAVKQTVKEVVKQTRRVPVYFGFVLTSKTSNIIVFRGTQTRVEWINNFTAVQRDYVDPVSGQYFGKAHVGLRENYHAIVDPLPREVAKRLNPAVPCYITGHSLGAAIAVLAALDIAVNVPALRKQIQLYTYAGPRVGNQTFAKVHSKLVPNSYRIVNHADPINLMPPTKVFDVYVHVGQEWSFLSQNGDVMPNHVVDTYRAAVEREVETNRSRNYPISGSA